jgi:hypothetical protein
MGRGRVGGYSDGETRKLLRRDNQRTEREIRRILAGEGIELSEPRQARSKNDIAKTANQEHLESTRLISLPQQGRQAPSDFSFNHLLGFMLAKRVNVLSPQSKEAAHRQEFIEGFTSGLSSAFMKDLSNPNITGLRIAEKGKLDNLKRYFGPLRRAVDKTTHNRFTKQIVSSTLEKLEKIGSHTRLAQTTFNENISQPVVKALHNFWDSLTKNFSSAKETPPPALVSI